MKRGNRERKGLAGGFKVKKIDRIEQDFEYIKRVNVTNDK
jgi:hypothetical protein